MVTCEVCGQVLETITWTHLRGHDLTVEEYRERFPNAVMRSRVDYVLPTIPTEVELSYFAGILDGEGSFGSYEQGPRITVAMNDEVVIDWILERFGGNKQLQGRCFRWTVYFSGCRTIIPLVLPYMIAKRGAATTVLRIANSSEFGFGAFTGERTVLTNPTRGNFGEIRKGSNGQTES